MMYYFMNYYAWYDIPDSYINPIYDPTSTLYTHEFTIVPVVPSAPGNIQL